MERFYRLPALVPAMDWMGKKAPRAPSYFSSREEKGALLLSWERVGEGEEKDPPIKYNLYASSIFPVDTEKGENIIALNRTDTCFLWEGGGETTRYWALTSMDAWGKKSEPISYKVSTRRAHSEWDILLAREKR